MDEKENKRRREGRKEGGRRGGKKGREGRKEGAGGEEISEGEGGENKKGRSRRTEQDMETEMSLHRST